MTIIMRLLDNYLEYPPHLEAWWN